MNEQHWEQEACPKYDCRKENCKCGMKRVFLATALGDDSEDSPIAPKNGAYCNAIVVYEANEHVYIYSTEGIPTLVESNGKEIKKLIEELEDGLAQEILDRQAADNALQQEIDDIKSSPDVVDIVATYAALQAYDTSHLGDNDIIRVLADETHDGQSTYYRWNKTTSTWTYIGAVGDYYTKGQVDNLLNGKQGVLTAGANVQISAQNVISATDTTYSNFVGTDGVDPGTAGLVPAPATTDAGKFLKADGTWDTASGGGDTVYSNKTTSDGATGGAVYIGNLNSSQQEQPDPTVTDYHFKYFWALPYSNSNEPGDKSINILGTNARANFSIALGEASSVIAGKDYGVAIGNSAIVRGKGSIAIGKDAYIDTNIENSLALGRGSTPTRSGEVNIGAGTTGYGYNSTNYRLLGGVHDPIAAHDAATKGYVDANAGGDTVYSNKSTSNSSTGGAVYIGNLDATQTEQADPTSTDNHYKYFWALPSSNSYIPEDGSINILGERARNRSIVIGNNASDTSNTSGNSNILIGNGNYVTGLSYRNVAIGEGAVIGSGSGDVVSIGTGARSDNYVSRSVALGSHAIATRNGEVNVGNTNGSGYNNTNYRVIGGVHNGIDAHDAATVAQAVGTTETFTKATSDWTALAASSPYTYSTTVTLATTLSASSEVELINDQLVAFANYGFGILSITGQVATIASIGQPDSSITFKIKVRG